MAGLYVHAGARHVDRESVYRVPTPQATTTHVPVAHEYLIDRTLEWISSDSLVVLSEQHALAHDGANYFGIFSVQRQGFTGDYALAVGLRNSHDKTYPVGLAVGSNVFVCDNLAFSAEIVVSRKHTGRVMADMTRLLADAFGRFGELFSRQDHRIAAYKEHRLSDRDAHDLVIRSVDADVMPTSRIPRVLTEWRQPMHEAFQPRTMWSLFNAFTSDAKTWPPMDLAGRTRRLHALFDMAAGLTEQEQPNG